MTTKPLAHLAVIPDGNRRLARRLMEKPWKGHEWGVQKLYKLMDWCREAGIRDVTFYALSLENLEKRPREELDFLFLLARKEIKDALSNPSHPIHRKRIKINFFGNLHLLPLDLQDAMKRLMAATRRYRGRTLNFAMAYGGRQEIVEAANLAAQGLGQGGRIDERALRQHLQTNGCGDPDLIIRTGGEKRLSNFLTFQSAYSELAFIDSFWPELKKREFLRVVKDFAQRERRFGK